MNMNSQILLLLSLSAVLAKNSSAPQEQRNTADRLKQSFPLIDTDGNNFISPEELELYLTINKSLMVTGRGNDEIFRSADVDEDGKLNYKEYAQELIRLQTLCFIPKQSVSDIII